MKFFNAVTKGNIIADGTVGALVNWLEQFINVLFPENGIEYWSVNQYTGQRGLLYDAPVPKYGDGPQDVRHAACYVRPGGCEGRAIEVALVLNDDSISRLAWIKTFDKDDAAWLVARAISEVLTSILYWDEIPEIVDMSLKVPRQYRWYRETNLKEPVTIASTLQQITISTRSGVVLENRSWADQGVNAKYVVEARLKDWKTVLTNLKVRFEEVTEKRAAFDDLPGYLFTDQGVEGVDGFYVLPPGGRIHFDCDWLGYYPNLDEAVRAARAHRDSKQQKAA